MSLHKVQIKLCCVASFLFLPPPFPSDVFITKPNVCLQSAKISQEREIPSSKMLKSHLRIRFLLPSVHPGSGAYETFAPSVWPAFHSCWQCAVFTADCRWYALNYPKTNSRNVKTYLVLNWCLILTLHVGLRLEFSTQKLQKLEFTTQCFSRCRAALRVVEVMPHWGEEVVNWKCSTSNFMDYLLLTVHCVKQRPQWTSRKCLCLENRLFQVTTTKHPFLRTHLSSAHLSSPL